MVDKLESSNKKENNAEKELDNVNERVELKPVNLLRSIRSVRLRLIPIWLRIILVFLLLFVAAVFGLIIGYSVIGEGELVDTFKASTWQHIFDIMNGKE